MTDNEAASPPPPTQPPETPPVSQTLTRANITGKVPVYAKSRRSPRKAGKIKMSPDRKQHVNQMKRSGLISPRAASSHGL